MNLFKTFRPWICWIIAVCFVILVFGFQTGYNVTNIKIASALELSLADIGLISASYTFFFAFSQIFSGAILDKFGIRFTLPIACAILTVGILLFSFSTSVTGFLFAQFFVALGGSFAFIGAGFTGKIWFSQEKYGMMFSWVQFVASTSACLIQLVFMEMLKNLAWHQLIIAFAIVAVLFVVIMFIFLSEPPSDKQPTSITHFYSVITHSVKDVWIVIKNKNIIYTVIIGAISFGVMLSVALVWGGHLLRDNGFNDYETNLIIALSWLGLAIGAPLFSYIAKFLTEMTALKYGLIGQALCLLLLLHAGYQPYYVAALVFAFGIFTGASMLPFAIAAGFVDKDHIGTSAALVNGGQFLMGSFLISGLGYIIGALPDMGMRYIMYILPLSLLIAVVLQLHWQSSKNR